MDYRLETLVDGKVVRSEQFSSLEDMIERSLQSLSFNDLVYLSDEEIEIAEQKNKNSKAVMDVSNTRNRGIVCIVLATVCVTVK